MRRPFALAAVACAGFGLTAALLGRLAPYPEMGDLDDKLRFFEAHRDDYDVLFFGSSRVHRGLMPAVFDAEMARRGDPVRSFNLGLDGMDGHETAALVRRVLATRPARLRWVVVELADPAGLGDEIRPENRFKARMVFWHDAKETAAAASEAAEDRSAGGLADHLLHGLAHATGAGRGRYGLQTVRDRLGARIGLAPSSLTRPLDPGELARTGGFEPFSEFAYAHPDANPLRRSFLSAIPEYRRQVERLSASDRSRAVPAAAPIDRRIADLVERQREAIRRAGATPLFVVAPTLRATPELDRLAAAGRVPRFAAFNDPLAYPALFAVENRFDRDHLTTEGARRFSRLLAARMASAAEGLPAGRRVAALRGAGGR